MTPENKAVNLVRKYHYLFKVDLGNSIDINEAKRCAIIVADEIIKALQGNLFVKSQIKYWQEVKTELEKL